MSGKAVAASLIVIWLGLFGVEFFEDLGLIHYSMAGMDEAMDETLEGFGNAIVTSADSGGLTVVSASVPYEAVYSSVSPNLSLGSGPLDLTNKTQIFQKHLRINKLLRVFLI